MRREFLKKMGVAVGFWAIPAELFLRFSGQTAVILQIVCEFPNTMAWSEFRQNQQKMVNLPAMAALETQMHGNGQLLQQNTHFDGDSVTWTYIFDCLESAKTWEKYSADHVDFAYADRSYVYHPPTYSQSKIYQIDWTRQLFTIG
jgi:hypothetical protein